MTFKALTTARAVIAETNLTDPADIAQEVSNRTPDADLRAAYLEALYSLARTAIYSVNSGARTAEAPTPKKPSRSAKVQAIREHHVTYYDQRVKAQGVWKLLGDCTIEDLQDMVAVRRAKANENMARAAEYERLIDAMQRNGASIARELGDLAVAS